MEKSEKSKIEVGQDYSFHDVLSKLLTLIGQPVQEIIEASSISDVSYKTRNRSNKLVEHACNLTATIIAELVAQVTGIGFDAQVPVGQQFHITPSRFSRISQNRTWNTGNGSPDAICFSVDRAGISVAGVTVYGGVGNEWHYELELLDYHGGVGDERGLSREASQSQHWRTIDMVRGTYSFEDKSVDVAEIKFERAIPIAPNVKVRHIPILLRSSSIFIFSMQYV